MGMSLDAGGHLTHGFRPNISGKMFHQRAYGTDRSTELLGGAGPRVMGTKGSHLVLDHPLLRDALGGRMAYFEALDGRVCIVYPFLDRVLVGSTDIPVDDPDQIATEPAEVDYLLEVLGEGGSRVLGPLRLARDVTSREVARLVPIIRDVLSEAIAAGGSSLRDYRQADGELGYFQHTFRVYDREGEACVTPGCKSLIARTVQSGRSSFHCPTCQR